MTRPSFIGSVRGEAIKVTRQLSFWLMLAGGLVLLGITVVGINTAGQIQDLAKGFPSNFARQMMDLYGTVFQIGSGILILIVGSRLIAMEYSSGTIRIAYARGVGRLQLLLSKMTLLALMAVALLAGYLLVVSGLVAALYASWTGNLLTFDKIGSDVWQDFQYWLLVWSKTCRSTTSSWPGAASWAVPESVVTEFCVPVGNVASEVGLVRST